MKTQEDRKLRNEHSYHNRLVLCGVEDPPDASLHSAGCIYVCLQCSAARFGTAGWPLSTTFSSVWLNGTGDLQSNRFRSKVSGLIISS
jgi:hypothetical protein